MIVWIVGLFRAIGIRDGIIAGLIVAIIFTAAQWHKASTDAANIRAVYANPQVKYVDRIVERQGPVRIRTVIVKESAGVETTTIDEERAPVETVSDRNGESAPVPVGATMTPTRTDRYLLTLGVNRLSSSFDGKAMFVGYGFKNRLDVQVGGIVKDGFSPWLLATVRF